MCVSSVFMLFCVVLCVSMQSICDRPICSPRVPIRGLSNKTQKQKVSDPGEDFLYKIKKKKRKEKK